MKKMSYVIVFAFALMLSINNAQATGTRSAFNNYEINLIQDFHMAKHVQAVWTLSYGDQNETAITVIKRKTIEGTEYRIQSECFSVNYMLTAEGFGVKDAKSSWSTVPKKINAAVLNQHEMARQKVLTLNKVTDEEALGLIASYLPDLLNDGYTHLLN